MTSMKNDFLLAAVYQQGTMDANAPGAFSCASKQVTDLSDAAVYAPAVYNAATSDLAATGLTGKMKCSYIL